MYSWELLKRYFTLSSTRQSFFLTCGCFLRTWNHTPQAFLEHRVELTTSSVTTRCSTNGVIGTRLIRPFKKHQVAQISKKNVKQRGDDYGSTLSLLNVQNGHLLLPLTCVLSIFDLRILRVNFRLFLGHHSLVDGV